ncbi:hypothetical protein FRC0493_00779 [Corynebacterium diphtheriae]|nr:hypothetical protein FRC0493_00779 [Corynebacterium diphtheriae]
MRSPGRPVPSRAVQRQFWGLIATGITTAQAALQVGVSVPVGTRWFRHAGGMRPLALDEPSGRYLSFAEREEIAILWEKQTGVREIARRPRRTPRRRHYHPSLGDGAGAESAAVADAAPNTATVVEYPLPVQEFAVTRYDLPAGTTVSTQLPGPAIALATSGVVTVNDLELAPGEAAWLPVTGGDTTRLSAAAGKDSQLFIAAARPVRQVALPRRWGRPPATSSTVALTGAIYDMVGRRNAAAAASSTTVSATIQATKAQTAVPGWPVARISALGVPSMAAPARAAKVSGFHRAMG